MRSRTGVARVCCGDQWPLRSVTYKPLYLDARTGRLDAEPPSERATISYQSTRADGRAAFARRFDAETELTGTMMLKLSVSCRFTSREW